MTGVVHVRDGSPGTGWKALNFGAALIHVKHSGTWKVPTGVWVKHSGTWKKVYPSDLEAWTTSNGGTESARLSSVFFPPLLSTDPDYVYTNITLANTDVRWDDRVNAGPGEWVRVWGFGWTPVTSAGFTYGAVTRIEVVFQGEKNTSTTNYWLNAGPQRAQDKRTTSALAFSRTTYTFDYTVAAWNMYGPDDDQDAGGLHTSPGTSNSIQVAAVYDNIGAGADQEVSMRNLKCRIKYKYN